MNQSPCLTTPGIARKIAPTSDPRTKTLNTPANFPKEASEIPLGSTLDLDSLRRGRQLRIRVGNEVLSDTVDEVMPDQILLLDLDGRRDGQTNG
jgi:sRNA-binding protein